MEIIIIFKWIFNTASSFNKLNGVYSKDNLPKIQDEVYIINLDEYSDIGTHWVTLYVQNNNNNVIYFDSFGVEHIPKEIKAFVNRPLSSVSQNKKLKQIFLEHKHMIR